MGDIPSIFHSFEHDEPFKTCLTCEQSFMEIDAPYTINKIFQGTECVFEYAICQPCRLKMIEAMSEKSRQHIQNFFETNPHFNARSEKLGESRDHTDWTRHCATCRTPLAEILNYSITCMGFGDDIAFDPYPMMICSDCESQVQDGLSKASRDQWDKFILDHFDGPPADALKPDGVPVLV